MNRKETKNLMEIVDADGDGELQFGELLDFVDAIAFDNAQKQKELAAKEWRDSQEKLRMERRETKNKRRLKQHLAAKAAGASATSFLDFVNAEGEDDGSNSISDGSESELDQEAIPTLEDVVAEYLERPRTEAVKAPLVKLLYVCFSSFLAQEAENASRLLAFYRKYDVDKSGSLDFGEFTQLMSKLTEESTEKMKPEEISELYMEAATLTPDNTRVDDQKFLLIMMCKGMVPSPFEEL